jgi:hypothetical protein
VCGIAAASTLASATGPAGVTITVTVPNDVTSTTITVPRAATTVRAADALQLKAAYADPAKIAAVADARTRRALQTELRDLDAFLARRAKLRPYRAHLWYVAHHTHPSVSARRLASLLWCTVWFPHDCG